jgi:murein DD-endopeptidase MepM/ murein hydrolase activator NlpD
VHRMKRRVAAAAAGLLLASVVAGTTATAPAGASSLTQRRDAAQRQRQALQVQIDLARATDNKVQGEVDRLTALLSVQTAKAAAAQQAARVALQQRSDAESQLNALTKRLDDAHRALVGRAVDTYMRPAEADASQPMLSLADVNESARRQALLLSAQGSLTDSLDSYRKDRQDLTAARARLQSAESVATHRAALELAQTLALDRARQSQRTAHDELQKRIDGLLEETRILASQENELQALIRSQDATYGGRFNGIVSNVGLIWPLHGTVTSEFGPRWGGFHPGIDIAAPYGAPIHAAKAGVVILAAYYGGYGNFVLIDHGGGIVTGYAHQSQMAVTQGQDVTQGQVIGYEGSTGYSTGPHVHFEVRVNGTPQNPRNYEVGNP